MSLLDACRRTARRTFGIERLRPKKARARLPISLGAACAVTGEIGGGGQGKVALDRACPSVTQKRPLVSHFPTVRWVALSDENESTGLPESSKRHLKNESGYRRKRGRQSAAAEARPWARRVSGPRRGLL
jgi:hypothetical protein